MILLKKMRKTTNFKAVNDEDVKNKAYLKEKLLEIIGHLSSSEKDYNEFKLQYNKQSVKEVLIQRAVKRTTQILCDKALFDNYVSAGKVPDDF